MGLGIGSKIDKGTKVKEWATFSKRAVFNLEELRAWKREYEECPECEVFGCEQHMKEIYNIFDYEFEGRSRS